MRWVDMWDRGIAVAMATAILGPPQPDTLRCGRVPEFEKLNRATRTLVLDRVRVGRFGVLMMSFV